MKILITGGSGFIGTNLIDRLAQGDFEILNIDKNPPKKESHKRFWRECNIMDKEKVIDLFKVFKPGYVVHLAANTDSEGKRVDDYFENTEGTRNVLEAIKATESIKRVVVTSSQFVHQYHGVPKSDTDYAPHTAYGESKVVSEIDTRAADLKCIWTIIRPTNIWGPWHGRYPNEFWKVLQEGHYFHPGNKPVIRSYGYVGNVAYQMLKILEMPSELVDKKVFYLGDRPVNLLDWVNGFSIAITGKKVVVVPRFFVKCLAMLGDLLSIFKIKFPITSSRYKSMTVSNDVSMEATFDLLGESPYSMQEGVAETVRWLNGNSL